MTDCASQYTVWPGRVLHCSGVHLQGNPFRDDGLVHQAEWHDKSFTWYDRETDNRYRAILSDDSPLTVQAQTEADAREVLIKTYGVEAATIVAISKIG